LITLNKKYPSARLWLYDKGKIYSQAWAVSQFDPPYMALNIKANEDQLRNMRILKSSLSTNKIADSNPNPKFALHLA